MKNFKLALTAAAVFTVSIFAATAQKATIDYRFNSLKDDEKNYFNWSADGKNFKDGFDVKSGASKAKSTSEFNIVRYDTTGKAKAVPGGLRSLVLYPVANRATAENDAFTVTAEAKKLVIRFVHRGTAYRITTDDKGVIDTSKSFEMAPGLADNVAGAFILKADYLKAGGDNTKMSDIDWTKVTFKPDTADDNATYKYNGTLNAAYSKDGILTVKGSLKK